MRYRSQKIILLVITGFLLSFSLASAKNFTIYNATNINDPYFSVNGTSGNVGIGITNPTTLLQILNNNWISAQNAAGNGTINMFRVNSNNQIEVGAPLNIGSFEFSPDSGLVSFVDMPVTSAPALGTLEGYALRVDGENILSVLSDANGSGGIQNKRVSVVGNVGIGNTNPTYKLDTNGSFRAANATLSGFVNAAGLVMSDATGLLYTQQNPVGNTLLPSGTSGHTLRYDGSAWVSNSTLYNNGTNVGVGTTLPAQRFSISGIGTAPSLNSTAVSNASLFVSNSDTGYGTYFATTGSGDGMIQQRRQTSAVYYNLSLNPFGGNVGVGNGSTVPATTLDVVSANANPLRIYRNSGNSSIQIQNNATSGYVGLNASNNIALGFSLDQANAPFQVTSAGNVGIGTNAPGTGNLLNIKGLTPAGTYGFGDGARYTGQLLIESNDVYTAQKGGRIAFSGIAGTGGGAFTGLTRQDSVYGTIEGFKENNIANNAGGGLIFTTNYNPTGVLQERMRITGNGNVGIGNTNPTYKLDTNGSFRAANATLSGFVNAAGLVMSDATGLLYTQQNPVGSTLLPSGTSGQTLRYNGTAWVSNSTLYNNGTNVGVGTTAPAQKLSVTDSFSITNVGGAQYLLMGNRDSLGVNNPGMIGSANGALSFGGGSSWTGNGGTFTTHLRLQDSGGLSLGNAYAGNDPGAGNMIISGNAGIGTTNPSVKLDVVGDIKSTSLQAGTPSAWSKVWTGNVSVPIGDGTTNLTAAFTAVNPISYRVRLFINGDTGTQTGATYLIRNNKAYNTDADNWEAKLVSRGGSSSNHVNLAVNSSTGVVSVSHWHPATAYTIGYIIEEFQTSNQSTFDIFGADNTWVHDAGKLYYSPGNVGISTTNPSYKLDTNGSFRAANATLSGFVNAAGLVMSDATGLLYTQQNPVGSALLPSGTSGQTLRYNGTAWVSNSTLYNNGTNVGIGTASPIGKLQIGTNTLSGANGVYENARIGTMVNGALTSMVYASTYNSPTYPDYGLVFMHASSTSDYNVWSISPDGPAKGNNLNFIYQANATNIHTQVPKIVFTGSGSVGIGTSTPLGKLHVVTPEYTTPIILQSLSHLHVKLEAADTKEKTLQFTEGGILQWKIGMDNAGANSNYFSIKDTDDAAPEFLINTSGNVGIGTTNPTYKLDTNGSFRAANATLSGFVNAAGLVMSDATGLLYTQQNPVGSTLLPSGTSGHTLRYDGSAWVSNSTLYNNGTNVGVGTTNPLFKLDVNGPAKLNYTYRDFQILQGASSNNLVRTWNGPLVAGADSSGALTYTVIETNVPQDSYMMGGFTIQWFENYSSASGGKTQINLSGYWNPESNGGFVGWEYTSSNPAVAPTIRVARKISDGKTVFILSHFNSSYPIIIARDLWLSYNPGVANYGDNWAILQTSDISGYTNLDTVIGRASIGGSGTTNYLSKFTGGLSLGNSLLYDNGTNVGIGVTGPTTKLDVNGNLLVRGTGLSASFGGTSLSPNATIANQSSYIQILSGSGGATNSSGLIFHNPSISTAALEYRNVDSNNGNFIFKSDDTNYNVGVGNTNPTYKLDVNGSLRASNATLSGFVNAAGLVMSDATGLLYTQQNPVGSTLLPSGTSGHTLRYDGSAWVSNSTLYNNGTNVGVGTTAPRAKLEVNATDGVSAGIVTGNLIEVAGQSDVAQAANITVTGGTLVSGGPTAKNGKGYWDITSFPATITFNTRGWWTYAGMSFTAANVHNYPAGGGNKLPGSFLVEASADGVTWGVVDDVTSYTSALYYKNNLYGGSGKFVRITARAPQSGETTAKLANVQIFNGQRSGKNPFSLSAEGHAVFIGGNVGVDTIQPSAKLAVTGNMAIGTTYGAMSAPTSGLIVEGNVGIGLTNPQAPLNVYKAPAAGFIESMRIGGTNNYQSLSLGINGAYTAWIGTYGNDLELYAGNWRTVGSAATENHNLRFYTSKSGSTDWSTAKMILNYDGNVGIGTTNPSYKLDTNGSFRAANATLSGFVNAAGLVMSDATGLLYTQQNPVGSTLLPSGTSGHTLRYNGTAWVSNSTLYNNGTNVGIGTTAPGAKLEIAGGTSSDQLRLGAGATNYYKIGRNTTSGFLDFQGTQAGFTGYSFKNDDGSTHLTILDSGNVGIGTTNPGAKLDVNGDFIGFNTAFVSGTAATASDWSTCVAPARIYNLATINANGTQNTFIEVEVIGSHRGYNITNYVEKKKWIIWVGDRVSSTLVESTGSANKVGLWNGVDASGFNNHVALGETIDLIINPACGAALTYTVNLRYHRALNLTIPATRFPYVDHSNYTETIPFAPVSVIGEIAYMPNNTGIGNSGPTYKLDVNGSFRAANATLSGFVNAAGLVMSDATGLLYTQQNPVGSTLLPSGTSGQTLRYNGTAWVSNSTLYNNGTNVGIGTTAPSTMLNILYPSYIGQNTVQGVLRLTGQSNTENSGDILSAGTALEFYNKWSGGGEYSVGRISGRASQSYDGGLQFDVAQNTGPGQSNFATAMTILDTGSIGIGTTNPIQKLQVSGNISLDVYTGSDFTRAIGINSAGGTYSAGSTYINFAEESGTGTLNVNKGGNIDFYNHKYAGGTNLSMRIQASGNVGIGTTNPSTKLDVNGTFRTNSSVTFSALNTPGVLMTDSSGNVYATSSISITGNYLPLSGGALSGDLNMSGNDILNINKLTVTTIDPLYRIEGVNYSTYAASIAGGVKEEYIGRAKITRAKGDIFEFVVDFNKIKKGDDLWVWRKTVDFSPENVEVLVSVRNSFARVYYSISDNKIIFHSDMPAEISYRLIGKRLDWKKWPTRALDQEETPGFVID